MQGQADIITEDISLLERFFLPMKKILKESIKNTIYGAGNLYYRIFIKVLGDYTMFFKYLITFAANQCVKCKNHEYFSKKIHRCTSYRIERRRGAYAKKDLGSLQTDCVGAGRLTSPLFRVSFVTN